MRNTLFIGLTLLFLLNGKVSAQQNPDSLLFMQTRLKASDCFERKAYDSAFVLYKKSYELAKEKKLLSYYAASASLLDMGHCLYNQEKYPQAHPFYYEALLNARRYSHHKDLKLKAVRMLNAVHDLVQTYDLPFQYPATQSFTEQVVYFDVDSVLWQQGDSALIRIKAGLYDGVIPGKNKAASLFSVKDAATGQRSTYLGTAEIRTAGNNKCMAMAKLKDTAKIIRAWQVQMLTNVPESVAGSAIGNMYRLNLKWKGNDNYLSIFNRRYFYYFNDTSYTRDLMDLLRNELADVVKRLGPDTLKPESAVAKISEDGIFKGKNLIRALDETNGSHVNYFLRMIVEYPFDYMAVPYRFSELYATWIIGNTPMQKDDIKGFILGNEKLSEEMIARAKLVTTQVEKENLVDRWIDEGLSLADKSYWKDVLSQGRLFYHYGRAVNRTDCRAWGDFFDAVRLKDHGYTNKADSLLKAAFQKFAEAGSFEGMQWITSVRKAVLDSTGIQMNIQKIHNLQYDMVPSPNERYFATAGRDGTIKFWDISLGKQIKSIDAHNSEVNNIAYNPGGRYLVSVSDDSTIKIWNTFSFGIMNTIKTPVAQRWVRFSPNGKTIVTSGYDSTLSFWDPFSGKKIKQLKSPGGSIRRFSFIPGLPNLLYLLCTDSSFYSYDTDAETFNSLLKSKHALWNLQISSKGKYLCYYSGDSSLYIYSLEGGRFIFSEKTFVWNFVDTRYYSTGDFSPDEKYYVYMRHDSTTVVIDLDQRLSVPSHSYLTGQYVFNNSGKYYLSQYVGAPSLVDFSAFNFNNAYAIYYGDGPQEEWNESYRSLKEKEFKTSYGPVLDMRFSGQKNVLEYNSYGSFSLDLESGKTVMLHKDPPWLSSYNVYAENNRYLFFRKFGAYDSLFVKDNITKTQQAALYLENGEKINTAAFTEHDTKCIIGGAKGTVACWNLQTKKIEYTIDGSINNPVSVTGLQKVPGTQQLILLRLNAKPLLLDASAGIITDSLPVPQSGGMVMNGEKFWLTDEKGRLFSGSITNLKKWDTLAFHSKSNYFDLIRLSPSGNYLMMLDVPFCHVMDTRSGKIVTTLQPELKNMQTMTISPNDSLLLIGTLNGEISIHKLETGTRVAKVFLPSPSDPIITDTSGYYLASKTALQSVIFSKGYRTYNYDQFDLEFNQPHKVLAAIGVADDATLSAYEKAREKRLKKSGISNTGNVQASSPSIIILNRSSINPSTNLDYYTIRTECYDFKNDLSEFRISVNDVPHHDSIFKLAGLDTGSIIIDVAVPLTPGNNRIKIYCTNKAGVSSYKEVIDIYSTASAKKQKTWFIGLGVAQYADTANNLIYSAKDIRDLAKRFKEIYPDIIIDTLLNKQVTLKNIAALKKRLQKISVTDRVIMAVTGHGLLSEKLDFYYATYDINFKKPEEKGLPYDQLEQILNETAARQKLLLIDACHSGLVDKENLVNAKSVIISEDSAKGENNIKETRGIQPRVTQRVDEANTFILMQNMFADFSNDNGIIVISAAGGLEYAFESPRWNNGVFTYSVLKGLSGEADMDDESGFRDKKISVQELMKYVGTMVPELTKGKQQPASRRENLEFDWIIK